MSAARNAAAHHPWDEAAEGWSRHSGLVRQWLSEATVAMLDAARIEPGQRVLDVAAGAGDQTIDIARRVGPTGSVLATDVSTRILELARANLLAAGLGQVSTRQADAQALGLANTGFDAVVCRLGLMFCTEPLAALNGIRSALAPGGRFAALVFAGPETNPCIALTMRTACRHAGVGPAAPDAPGSLLSLGRPGLLESLLHEAGFKGVQVHPVSAPFRTARCADYVDFVRTSGSPLIEVLKSLTPQARADAWADITSQLERFSTDGAWEGPNELLLCSAVKQ
jgi:ubiquinone/menaquinone biosynthesis C-methylase UbiE